MQKRDGLSGIGFVLLSGILTLGVLGAIRPLFAVNIGSQVTVGNAAPVVSNVVLNNGSAITLTANTTTAIIVNYTVSDANGCGDVFFNGGVSTTVHRSGVGATCSASNLSCYITTVITSHSCPSSTSTQQSADATTTLNIYYFADATDASSSYSGENWDAAVVARDQGGATSTANATNVELITLNAIDVLPTTLNYGTLAAGTDTGSTNQLATTTNAGNSSTTLQLHAVSTLSSGSSSIATSSQRYSTSTFTFAGTSTAITGSPVTVSGFSLRPPTSTSPILQLTYWGLEVPGGTPTGTYSGTNGFTPLYIP